MTSYAPSPSERVRDQVARYEATGGADGGELAGLPVIILTTTGARSGNLRKTPIMRVERDGVYAAIASYAGGPSDPQWYHNLVAHPDAEVQDGAEAHRVRARELSGAEKQASPKRPSAYETEAPGENRTDCASACPARAAATGSAPPIAAAR